MHILYEWIFLYIFSAYAAYIIIKCIRFPLKQGHMHTFLVHMHIFIQTKIKFFLVHMHIFSAYTFLVHMQHILKF